MEKLQVAQSDPTPGWRYWQLDPESGLLRSVTKSQIEWRPGHAMQAVCLIGGHAAPAAGCACGIYASPDVESLRLQTLCLAPGRTLVMGQVSLWGTVIADDHGLRAEFAYPVHLSLVTPTSGADPAGDQARLSGYGVPVDTIPAEEAIGDVAAAILAFQAMSR